MKMNQFLTKAFRRKVMGTGGGTTLARKLGVIDITTLGVGSTLGAGIYVITGAVAHKTAGPAIVLSFAIAGMASILAGLAYAEFGSRVPKAGSAYVYSFVAVGELIAWLTGWNLILEYIIGASSVARGWSSYADTLLGHWIRDNINAHIPAPAGISPDVFSLFITLVLTLVVGVGVKESTTANNVLTALNVVVILVIIVAGSFYVEPSNWDPFVPPEFGTLGVFKGAATCFYAYIGFDVIATSAEETKNPSRNVPIGIIASLTICALSYMAVSAIVTLMQPYNMVSMSAPLAGAFGAHGATWAKIFISVGALAGLSTSLMASIFPLPRIIYAIASDGLLWPWLGAVNKRFQTPLNATLVSGLLAGIMAFLLSIDELADMMSIGTLMSYTMVGACVIILRYEVPNANAAHHLLEDDDEGGEGGLKVADLHAVDAVGGVDAATGLIRGDRGVFAETPPALHRFGETAHNGDAAARSRTMSAGGAGGGVGRHLDAQFDPIVTPVGSVPEARGQRVRAAAAGTGKGSGKVHGDYAALDDGAEEEERELRTHSTVSSKGGSGGSSSVAASGTASASDTHSTAASRSSSGLRSSPSDGVGINSHQSEGAVMLSTAHTPDTVTAAAARSLASERSVLLASGTAEKAVQISAGWLEAFVAAQTFKAEHTNRFRAVVANILLYTFFTVLVAVAINVGQGALWGYIMLGVFGAGAAWQMVVMAFVPEVPQPQLKFKCPWVPLLPMVSMGVNVYLLASLSVYTWIRFSIWTVLGFAIYFWYGVHNSRASANAAKLEAEQAPKA